MAYTKIQLIAAVSAIVGEAQLQSLGLPRALDEAALQLFLNDDACEDAVLIVKESLSDIRDFGAFRFLGDISSVGFSGKKSKQFGESEIDGLIQSFEYIESGRAAGFNKSGRRRRLSQEKCADLYYAGLNIVNIVKEFGTEKQKARMAKLHERFLLFFD